MAWGNTDGSTRNQHMISPAGFRLEVTDVDDDAIIALKASNTDGINAVAIEAAGQVKVTAVSADNPASVGLTVTNTSQNQNARAIVVNGRADFDGVMGLDGSLNISGAENGINGTDGQLWLGVSDVTDTVVISHNNGGEIRTLGNLRAMGGVDGDENDLAIGTTANTDDITIGRIGQTCTFNSAVEIGADEDDPALLDAALDDADPRNLNIGTQASTGNVFMGRNGQFVTVNGSLAVGPTNSNGVIDSGGTPASIQHLKIGTGTGTKDVILGRATRTVDMMSQARMNSNGIVMNGASSVTDAAGIGFVVNAVGHGNGASIDFYINGVVEGWLDATGFVNA